MTDVVLLQTVHKVPVRCYSCQKFNHTSSTCHARTDMCGLCGGHHRTRICVDKRKANEAVTLKSNNCKGNHCRASRKCPYRQEVMQKARPPSTKDMDRKTFTTARSDTYNTQTAVVPVYASADPTFDGGLPGHPMCSGVQSEPQPDTGEQSTTSQNPPTIATTNTSEKTPSLRGLENCGKETSQPTSKGTCSETINKQLHSSKTCVASCSTTRNQTHNNRHTVTSTQQYNQGRDSNVSEGHSSHELTHHDYATPTNVPDGGYPAQPIYTQHNESNITKHARHNTEI